MSDRPPFLAYPPSWADPTPLPPGAWCRVCYGTRWWTEKRELHGWRCMTCHSPTHLAADTIRREGEGEAAPRRGDADPLFQGGVVARSGQGVT